MCISVSEFCIFPNFITLWQLQEDTYFNCDGNVYFNARLNQLLSFKTMFLLKRTSYCSCKMYGGQDVICLRPGQSDSLRLF